MADTHPAILRTDQLKTYYVLDMLGKQKIVKAVNGVDLNITENEIYGIAGESGCGKTTLLKALFTDIIPPLRLIGGKVYYRVDGKGEIDATALSQEEKRKLRLVYISNIPQGSMSVLNPVLRIRETYKDFIASHFVSEVRVPIRKPMNESFESYLADQFSGQSHEDIFEQARKQIIEFGLPKNVLDVYPHQLSGGMRQRVTIALAALMKPRIMIGDEPTTALDVVVQRGVIQMLKDIQKRLKNTIVVVTHDMGVQANLADRIGIMYAGKIVEESTSERIFAKPQHPYTQFLIDSLPKLGDKSIRSSVPGSPPSLADLPDGCPFHPRCPKVMDVCRRTMPGFSYPSENHKVACWLFGEGEHGKAA
ncbi:MAG: ABC transporter ATP-binding protein [Anaerolineales bacterium]|nr:ABC transporter ATP-binding protein [Anaerolineales bacterium]